MRQRPQRSRDGRLDTELGQLLEAGRPSLHGARGANDASAEPGRGPLGMAKLVEVGNGRIEGIDRHLSGARRVTEHEQQGEAVQVSPVQLAKRGTDNVRRGGIGFGSAPIG